MSKKSLLVVAVIAIIAVVGAMLFRSSEPESTSMTEEEYRVAEDEVLKGYPSFDTGNLDVGQTNRLQQICISIKRYEEEKKTSGETYTPRTTDECDALIAAMAMPSGS